MTAPCLSGLLADRIPRPRRARGTAAHSLAGAVLAVLTGAGAVPAQTPPAARETGLTVAILDLAEAPSLQPSRPAAAQRPAWRTSFGSERKTESETMPEGGDPLAILAAADVVLIQGVQAAAPLRRFFPPRTWRLIVSRKIIPQDGTFDRRIARADLPAATAIAVKARASLRVTARAHALRLDAASEPVAPERPAAATAVRLVERGRTVWLASVALPSTCEPGAARPCTARRNLDAWRESQRARGEPTVVGGRMVARPPAADTPPERPACAFHGIESDVDRKTAPRAAEANSADAETGCIVIVTLAE